MKKSKVKIGKYRSRVIVRGASKPKPVPNQQPLFVMEDGTTPFIDETNTSQFKTE
jgi:hypothetical protein